MTDTPILGRLRAAYKQADKLARTVAHYNGTVAIPAHNELRYAGYHLLSALSDDAAIINDEEIRRAISHCERSIYEAAEAGITDALERIGEFKEDYKSLVIVDVIPDWPKILVEADKAREFIVQGRRENDPEAKFQRYEETFKNLVERCRLLDANRDDLNTKIRQQNLEDERRKADDRRFFFKMGLSILSVTALIALTVFRVFD